MQATTTTRRRRELNAIVHAIRESWSEEEREKRRRIGDVRRQWLLGMLEETAAPERAAS